MVKLNAITATIRSVTNPFISVEDEYDKAMDAFINYLKHSKTK